MTTEPARTHPSSETLIIFGGFDEKLYGPVLGFTPLV